MPKIEFNINNYAEFELTEYGAKILNDRDIAFMKSHPSVNLFTNKIPYVEGQQMKMQFWDVMNTFGEHTSIGLEIFCKNATIVLEVKE